ncbi:MAG TPA: hypothetical protein VMW48_04695 [Vicinamibacterales bacterium]|nr:hypothetical protein [Vicinamibacterales bacterium]
MSRSRWSLAVLLVLVAAGASHSQTASAQPGLLHTSDAQRRLYLGSAAVWAARDTPTPAEILAGPVARNPLRGIALTPAGELECTYLNGGAGAAGRTEKFTCRTAEGRTVRVKYYDGNPKSGNREVFAEVVSTRLFWALGFDADAMFPVVVQCSDCPENPNSGKGPRARRRFLGVVEAFYEGTIIASTANTDQGWGFAEVSSAIDALPAGPDKDRQRTHFDALTLLAVFVQHGDRKPSQQRLVCVGPLDLAKGDLHAEDDDNGFHLPVLFERAGAAACDATRVTVQDLGATMGGAGYITRASSKVSLASWAKVEVFAGPRRTSGICRGRLAVAAGAGSQAGGDLPISESGRRFLFERLSTLTPDHIRALFDAARVGELDEPQEWKDAGGAVHSGIDGWVAAFADKVAQVGRRRCES